MIERLVILGATGDLTERLLLPALASLAAAGDLPPDFHLVGTGSRGWSQDQFRAHLHQALADQGNAATNLDEVIQEAQYRRVDVTEPGAVHHLVQEFAAAGPLGIYLALPTSLIGAALEAMQGLALPRGSRIAIEKPFGHDVGSAEHLNDLLGAVVGENAKDAVYRVDHVLAMSSLQNLLTLRAHNRMIGATWSDEHIERIEILWEETIDLQGRAAYYDRAGALRDVMQNHMMQVLCWVAMEPPAEPTQEELDAAELEVARHTSVVRRDDGRFLARRARYTSGILADTGGADGRLVEDYTDQEGVQPDRDTETFAEVVLRVDTPRWHHTRFVMRAGKALADRRKGVLVHYRPAHGPGHPGSKERPGVDNRMWIGIDGPDDIRVGLWGSTLGPPRRHEGLVLSAPVPASTHPPYAHVLSDFLSGGNAHAVTAQEPVEAWRIFEPVLAEWDEPDAPMHHYPAGTDVRPRSGD